MRGFRAGGGLDDTDMYHNQRLEEWGRGCGVPLVHTNLHSFPLFHQPQAVRRMRARHKAADPLLAEIGQTTMRFCPRHIASWIEIRSLTTLTTGRGNLLFHHLIGL